MCSSCLQGQERFGRGVSSTHSGIEFGWRRTGEESSGGRKREVAGPSYCFHIISARPPEQPRMLRTFLKVHTRLSLANALRCRDY